MRSLSGALAVAILAVACGAGESPGAEVVDSTTVASGPSTTAPPVTAPVVGSLDVDAAGFDLVGISAGGRPLVATTLGSGATRVYVIGGIHGDERTGIENSRALLEHLRTSLPPGITVRWLLDANPDGSAANRRDNANGVDINRNWPTSHFPTDSHGLEPLSEPETRALLDEIETFDPDVIVAMHSAREGPFANYDGPGEALAAAFAAGATGDRIWEVVPEVDWPTPGSLGTHFGRTLDVPVVTVEGNRWDDPAAILPELTAGLDALLAAAADGPSATAPVCSDHRVGNSCSDLTRRVVDVLHDGIIGGTSGFLMKEAGGLVEAARWADVPTYPASSIKIVHFLAVLRLAGDDVAAAFDQVITTYSSSCDASGSTGTARVGDLVERMLIESDNAAANALQAWIGLDTLDATARAAGMVSTRIEHGFGCGGPSNEPANSSTIADLVTLYDGVATGTLLDPGATEVFMASLLDITAVVFDELGLDATPGVRIVAKAGWYDRNLSIGGIAVTPSGTFVFGAYTDAPQGIREGFTIERVVAELLRDHIVPAGS